MIFMLGCVSLQVLAGDVWIVENPASAMSLILFLIVLNDQHQQCRIAPSLISSVSPYWEAADMFDEAAIVWTAVSGAACACPAGRPVRTRPVASKRATSLAFRPFFFFEFFE